MIGRMVLGTLASVTLLTGPVATARACHFFDRCCGRAPTTTYYAPVAVAAPTPCCAQRQVVNYMPQTCYRTVYVNSPVTSFQPSTACDACGRATTVMRPVTTFVARPQLVPYTTFRPVVTQMPVAQPCCGATPTVTSYAAPVTMAPAAPATPSCCTPASATTVTPVPAPATYSPAPVTSTPVPAATNGPLTPVPSLDSTPPSQPQQTFENSPSDINAPQSRVLMPPSSSGSSISERPRGLDPESFDRTTAIPLHGGATVRQASLVVPVKAQPQPVDTDGWRAGH